jgi:hypothetical protein
MKPVVRVACTAALALLVPACEGTDRQPLGPTALDEGIIIYIHAGFRGSSQAIAIDVSNLGDVEGPCVWGDDESTTVTWDDCISSIRVMPGWGVTAYRDRGFSGQAFEFTSDSPDLSAVSGSCKGSFNDCISSLRVYRR